MAMQSGPFDSVPLATLFPQSESADHIRMRHAAAVLDAERSTGDEPRWDWFPQHIIWPGGDVRGVPQILSTAVSLYDKDSDWLELELDVEWTGEGLLNVCTAVSVACWCAKDHNTHYVNDRDLAVDDRTSLGSAFEAGVGQLIELLAGPRDPEVWRLRSGLPPRSAP
ncbi:hypothetical protein [Streptomyces sp. NPDC026673]|uniref:hypothetical protein n=1 Tax=Streptomyces sp. NPDC026673 TaxID=3155724 RepID=UPI0033ED38B7